MPNHYYIGYTADLKKRLQEHNSGKSVHTNKFKPWTVRTYIGFDDKSRAEAFEKYLKSSSGRAFMTKRF
jgi:putative endonuclease